MDICISGYILLDLVAKIVPGLATGASFTWIPCASPKYSLALEDAAGLSYKFSAPVLESAVSSGRPARLLPLEKSVRNQGLGAGYARCCWGIIHS